MLVSQILQQRLRLLQIARVEPLSEPPVHRSQQIARLLHLALVAPEAREACGGAEFPGFGLLLAGNGERTLEIELTCPRHGLWYIWESFAALFNEGQPQWKMTYRNSCV